MQNSQNSDSKPHLLLAKDMDCIVVNFFAVDIYIGACYSWAYKGGIPQAVIHLDTIFTVEDGRNSYYVCTVVQELYFLAVYSNTAVSFLDPLVWE